MHTQTESAHEHRAGIVSLLAPATGLGLYLLTLSGEVMLGASARWLLVYLGAATVGIFVSLGLSAESYAYAAAFAPLAWSALGLLSPGRGSVWRRRLGARRPSEEEAEAIRDSLATLRADQPSLSEPGRCYVLDDPLPGAAVRGRVMVLNRGLIESDALAPVLAHELAHANSLDGRLTEALERLELWGDPLAPLRPDPAGRRPVKPEPHEGRLLLGLARWLLRFAGGGEAERLLSPLWSAYWRWREHAADAYAAGLGQAEDLARHLADYELSFDAPQPRLLFNRALHPPVSVRIERLRGSGGSR